MLLLKSNTFGLWLAYNDKDDHRKYKHEVISVVYFWAGDLSHNKSILLNMSFYKNPLFIGSGGTRPQRKVTRNLLNPDNIRPIISQNLVLNDKQ